jgi:hypothetical protein
MNRLVLCKEPGSENYLRNVALDLITRSEGTQQALDLAALIAYSSGLDDKEALELVAWVFTFSLIICVAAKP